MTPEKLARLEDIEVKHFEYNEDMLWLIVELRSAFFQLESPEEISKARFIKETAIKMVRAEERLKMDIYLQDVHAENRILKSQLQVAKAALEKIADVEYTPSGAFNFNMTSDELRSLVREALKEIEEMK